MRQCFSILLILFLHDTSAQTPTFNGDVASIIFNNCVVCHRSGNIAPFPMTNYAEVTAVASSLTDAVNQRRMPPWMPDPAYSHFKNERVLSNIEIQKINDWVSSGMAEGDTIPLPPLPIFSLTSAIGNPDIQYSLPQYTLSSAQEEYRCFVIPSAFVQDEFVQAFEFMPGNSSVDHHAEIFWDTTGICQQLDLNDTLPGYSSFSSNVGSNNAHLIYIWVPGTSPFVLPDKFGFKIPAGADIIAQIHYRAGGAGQIDSSHLNIFFQQNTPIREVKTMIKNHIGNGFLNPPLYIPADSVKTFYASDTSFNKLSYLGIMPHMHQVGSKTISYAIKTNGDTVKLISIPHWNFSWQSTYMFQKLIVLSGGSVINTNSTYDNTTNNLSNPFYPPQNISAGFATTEEMFLTAYYFVNFNPGDENVILDSSLINNEINILDTENSVVVFPNPSSGKFTASVFSSVTDVAAVSIYNIEGKEIIKREKNYLVEKGENHFECNSVLANGIYFLRIKGKKINAVQKIVVIN